MLGLSQAGIKFAPYGGLQKCACMQDACGSVPELSSALFHLLWGVSLSGKIVNFEFRPEQRDAVHDFPYPCLHNHNFTDAESQQVDRSSESELAHCIARLPSIVP